MTFEPISRIKNSKKATSVSIYFIVLFLEAKVLTCLVHPLKLAVDVQAELKTGVL